MIKVLSGQQMRKIDQKATKELEIPGILLMENAGRAVYQKIEEIAGVEDKSVLVICGKGNNGGDGFVAARHLMENSIQTTVISLFRPDSMSKDALINHNILQNFAEIVYLEDIDINRLKGLIAVSDVIVDAVFGTGLNSEVRGMAEEVINSINEYAEGEVVAVDIPSGICADTGKILGCAVIADYTVTFHCPKLGLLLYPGTERCGEIMVETIGIPEFLNDEKEINTYLITNHYAHILLPLRPENAHKGIFGKVFNISGSYSMTGAAYMCAMSSLLVGAGYSILAATKPVINSVASKASEIIYVPLEETSHGTISENALPDALDKSFNSDVIAIGPGLSTDESTVKFVAGFIQQVTNRADTVLIDGDALNSIALQENRVLPLNSVITPHPKELSRLMDVSLEDILEDRLGSARNAALKLNTIVVLKGANTIIAEPDGNAFINVTGNSGLATAGSGDVLSGIIAGFIARGVEPKDAAILGVYLHGLAANIAVESLNDHSLTAVALMDYIPDAINKLTRVDD